MSFLCTRFKMPRRSGLLSGLVLWLVLATGVNVASAHSELAESNPADGATLDEPPDQVSLTFTEELDTDGSSVAIFDRNEQQVDDGNGGVDLNDLDHQRLVVGLPASLANGAYTVRWTAVSTEDGDVTTGAIGFTIGAVAPVGGQPIGDTSSSPSSLLLLAGLIAVILVVGGAIYVGRKRAIPEKEKVAGLKS